MRALLIAEKPDLMKNIRDAYNKKGHPDDITFKSFVGHTMGLKMPGDYKKEWEKRSMQNLPMIPSPFEYQPVDDKKKIFNELKREVHSGKYDYVINACDPGREGQHIFFSFYDAIGAPLPVKRIWHADLTTDELSRALHNLLDEKEDRLTHMTQASKLRAYFDWLVGMNYSSGFSLVAKNNISAGRVMSPTLKIVVDRELELLNFVSKPFWNVESDFDAYKGSYQARKDSEYQTNFDKKKDAEDFIKSLGKTGIVSLVEKKKQTRKAPQLFSLQTLSTQASKAFGYSMSETLKITQGLYEKKLLSYPRTDSAHITGAIAKDFAKLLAPLTEVPGLESIVPNIVADSANLRKIAGDKMYVDDKKVTDHYAITPTGMKPNWDKLSKKEQTIYDMVAKRFVAIFMPPLITMKTRIVTDVDGHDFVSNGSVLSSKGFTILYGYNPKDAELPDVKKGDTFNVKEFNLIEKKTTPPSRYTDGTLGQAMENAGRFVDDKDLKEVLKESKGIGTPATRGSIVDKLVRKNMIAYEKKAIKATDYGISLISNLGKHDVTSVEMTAEWESKLQDVEDGKLTANDFYKDMIQYITRTTEDIKTMTLNVQGSAYKPKGTGNKAVGEVIGACPKCASDVKVGNKYYLCDKYKESCDFIFGTKQWGANISKTEAKKILKGKETKQLSFKNGSKAWKGTLIYDKAQGKVVPGFASSSGSSTSSPAPKDTGTKTLAGENILTNQYYYYTEQSNMKIPKDVWGVPISIKDAVDLLAGKTLDARTFTWKSGKRSKAKLSYDKKQNKIKYTFA